MRERCAVIFYLSFYLVLCSACGCRGPYSEIASDVDFVLERNACAMPGLTNSPLSAKTVRLPPLAHIDREWAAGQVAPIDRDGERVARRERRHVCVFRCWRREVVATAASAVVGVLAAGGVARAIAEVAASQARRWQGSVFL